MAFKTSLFLCFVVIIVANAEKLKNGLRMQGSLAEDGQFPYIAGMWISGQVGCTGTILDEHHILTAWSCPRVPYTHILVGTNNWDDAGSGYLYPIEEWIYHPEAYPIRGLNDIAVIRVTTPIQFNEKVQPVNLVKKYNNARMIGWSSFYSADASAGIHDLLYRDVEIISTERCLNSYGNLFPFSPSIICAVDENGLGPCGQDGGNPLMVDGEQVGLASFVKGGYCDGGGPDVFTDISLHLDWIEEVTTRRSACNCQ